MGGVESVNINDVCNPKSGRITIKGKNFILRDIVEIYNTLIDVLFYVY